MSPHRPHRHGRDRRAQRLPPAPGRPTLPAPGPAVAVVGGGIAGLAAATALAERGARVSVLEAQPHLGGRLAGWPLTLADGSTVTMSRGFHAFFRQYYNLRGLLRRVDADLGMLHPLPDYPLQHGAGARDSFAHLPRTPPWNALGFLTASPTFSLTDLTRMNATAALPLLDVRVPRIYQWLDHLSAAEFLTTIGFPPAARHLAFQVFSRSFFADPHTLSAAELALMFHIYFLGSSEGLLFDVPTQPFPTALWHPLAHYLRAHRAQIHTATPVHTLTPTPHHGYDVTTTTGTHRYDAVVLALDTPGLRTLAAHSPHLGDAAWRARLAELPSAPPFLVTRVWLDRPVSPRRPGFLGTSGYGPLDNISVLDRWEDQAAHWARRTGGSVLELHSYAVPPGTDRRDQERRLLAELPRVYPETAAARPVHVVHHWAQDCPLFPVGGHPHRPTVHTPDPGVVLAGDLVRTDLPVALMERAATTGFLAANTLLARWGVSGQTLWTVPTTGRSPALRALARHHRPAAPAPQPVRPPPVRSRQRRSA